MSTALADLKNDLKKDLAKAGSTLPATGGRTISTKGKVFTMPNSAVVKPPLEAIILDYRNVNRLYPPYDATKVVPPSCFAIAREVSEMEPHESAPSPEAASCSACPKNEYGSAAGSKGKACRNGVRFAVVPVDANAGTPIWDLYASPTALKHWAKYLSELIAMGLHPAQVVTKIGFSTSADYPQLIFKAGEQLDADAMGRVLPLREAAKALVESPLVQEA